MKHQTVVIRRPKDILKGCITLPGSKSESNRALIIQALCKHHFDINNLSIAEDTVTLQRLLESIKNGVKEINVGPAGTAMRFLTAYLSVIDGKWLLTGTHRMLERPIRLLVDALKELGADIEYVDKEGYPPLRIRGVELNKTNCISIAGNVSSQYISALLMIAPTLYNGLKLTLLGNVTSKPYIEMTLSMMNSLGIQYTWNDDIIKIEKQDYKPNTLYIEPDWSGASYWYAMVALSSSSDIKLLGLKQDSLQGDRIIANIMTSFGVETVFEKDGIRLHKLSNVYSLPTIIDFEQCPDIAQTLAVVCAGLGHNCVFIGLESLKIKETDRVQALRNELAKFGVSFVQNGLNYHLDCTDSIIGKTFDKPILINTYHDHRMAMAFSALALKVGVLEIENPLVTVKSYPDYWVDLQNVGFLISLK
jgi:3-phosphoshikimate 1-carboxyvinyltransferase